MKCNICEEREAQFKSNLPGDGEETYCRTCIKKEFRSLDFSSYLFHYFHEIEDRGGE